MAKSKICIKLGIKCAGIGIILFTVSIIIQEFEYYLNRKIQPKMEREDLYDMCYTVIDTMIIVMRINH